MKINATVLAAACLFALTSQSINRADVVSDWNEIAENVIRATPPPSPPLQVRALAIVNAAIYDAVNGINRKYEPHFVTDPAPPGARQEAAVVGAAFTALKGLFPGQSAMLEMELADSLQSIPGSNGNSQSIERGLAWGEHVAQVILMWRAADGLSTPAQYTGGTAPGQWRALPPAPANGSVPQFGKLTPFTMISSSQFRPGPPPPLDSARYAADLNEVKAMGRIDSATRSPIQTQISLLWANSGPLEENAVVRSVVPASYDLDDTARLFALVNFAGCDAMIAGFDAKYHYGFWRPFHAIRLADTAGNPATEPDTGWTSFLVAPNHPEYVSTHSIVTGAGMRVLSLLLGDETPFTVRTPAMGGLSRDYARFSDAASEVGLSRIWGGIHFRTACDVGLSLGNQIAEQAVATSLLPR